LIFYQEFVVMPKSVILHIGPNKTGTTYIQRELSASRALLAERAAICYPEIKHSPRYGHHCVVTEFRREGSSKTLADLLETCNPEHHLLLSSENFSKLEGDAIAGLAKQLTGHQVTLVYAVRRPIEIMYSTWQQKIKVGRSLTWPEFFLEQLTLGAESSLLNPAVTVAEYLKHLPDCQMRLIDYSGAIAAKKNIANLVIEAAVGVELPEFSEAANNVSIEADHAEVLRALNARYWMETGIPANGFRVQSAARKQLKLQPALFESLKSRVREFSHEIDVCAVDDSCIKYYVEFVRAYDAYYWGPRDPGTIKKKIVALPDSCWIQDAATLAKLDAVYAQLPIKKPGSARKKLTSASDSGVIDAPPQRLQADKAARSNENPVRAAAFAEKRAKRQAARKSARAKTKEDTDSLT